MEPIYPTVKLDGHDYKSLWKDKMYEPRQAILYKITNQDLLHWPGHVYEWLAMRFYGFQKLWWVIYDANSKVAPDAVAEDMVIRIPVINPMDAVNSIMSA